MTTDHAGSKAPSSDADLERGNSGEGKDPDQGAQKTGAEDEEGGSKAEKDARAFDHPGRAGQSA